MPTLSKNLILKIIEEGSLAVITHNLHNKFSDFSKPGSNKPRKEDISELEEFLNKIPLQKDGTPFPTVKIIRERIKTINEPKSTSLPFIAYNLNVLYVALLNKQSDLYKSLTIIVDYLSSELQDNFVLKTILKGKIGLLKFLELQPTVIQDLPQHLPELAQSLAHELATATTCTLAQQNEIKCLAEKARKTGCLDYTAINKKYAEIKNEIIILLNNLLKEEDNRSITSITLNIDKINDEIIESIIVFLSAYTHITEFKIEFPKNTLEEEKTGLSLILDDIQTQVKKNKQSKPSSAPVLKPIVEAPPKPREKTQEPPSPITVTPRYSVARLIAAVIEARRTGKLHLTVSTRAEFKELLGEANTRIFPRINKKITEITVTVTNEQVNDEIRSYILDSFLSNNHHIMTFKVTFPKSNDTETLKKQRELGEAIETQLHVANTMETLTNNSNGRRSPLPAAAPAPAEVKAPSTADLTEQFKAQLLEIAEEVACDIKLEEAEETEKYAATESIDDIVAMLEKTAQQTDNKNTQSNPEYILLKKLKKLLADIGKDQAESKDLTDQNKDALLELIENFQTLQDGYKNKRIINPLLSTLAQQLKQLSDFASLKYIINLLEKENFTNNEVLKALKEKLKFAEIHISKLKHANPKISMDVLVERRPAKMQKLDALHQQIEQQEEKEQAVVRSVERHNFAVEIKRLIAMTTDGHLKYTFFSNHDTIDCRNELTALVRTLEDVAKEKTKKITSLTLIIDKIDESFENKILGLLTANQEIIKYNPQDPQGNKLHISKNITEQLRRNLSLFETLERLANPTLSTPPSSAAMPPESVEKKREEKEPVEPSKPKTEEKSSNESSDTDTSAEEKELKLTIYKIFLDKYNPKLIFENNQYSLGVKTKDKEAHKEEIIKEIRQYIYRLNDKDNFEKKLNKKELMQASVSLYNDCLKIWKARATLRIDEKAKTIAIKIIEEIKKLDGKSSTFTFAVDYNGHPYKLPANAKDILKKFIDIETAEDKAPDAYLKFVLYSINLLKKKVEENRCCNCNPFAFFSSRDPETTRIYTDISKADLSLLQSALKESPAPRTQPVAALG